MRMLAGMTLPWVKLIRMSQAISRAPADDFATFAKGQYHIPNTIDALLTTHQYIVISGGVIQTQKTWIMTTSRHARTTIASVWFVTPNDLHPPSNSTPDTLGATGTPLAAVTVSPSTREPTQHPRSA